MKKLLVVTALVSVLTMSLPVFASSPTAGTALTPGQQQEVTTEAAALLAGGVISTPAAANAVATALVRMKDAKALTTADISKEALAIYNTFTPEMKALVEKAAKERGLSIEEVVGNFIKAVKGKKRSRAIAWNANTCMSAIDGKAGNVFVNLSKASDAVEKDAEAQAGDKFINVFDFALQNGKGYKAIDTAFNVEGVTAKDSVNTIGAKQFYGGAWHDVPVTGVAKNAVGLHITNVGPIMLYQK